MSGSQQPPGGWMPSAVGPNSPVHGQPSSSFPHTTNTKSGTHHPVVGTVSSGVNVLQPQQRSQQQQQQPLGGAGGIRAGAESGISGAQGLPPPRRMPSRSMTLGSSEPFNETQQRRQEQQQQQLQPPSSNNPNNNQQQKSPGASKSEDLNHQPHPYSKRSNNLFSSTTDPHPTTTTAVDDFMLPPPLRPSSRTSSNHSNASSGSSSAMAAGVAGMTSTPSIASSTIAPSTGGGNAGRLPGSSIAASAASSQSTLVSTTCNACGRPMQGPFVRALGTVFHLNCFKCLDCGDVVASKFFPIDGPDGKQSPLCECDYFRRLNLICSKCGTALRGSYITACNKKYHVEHFTCTLCDTVFGAQDSYYEHEGDVYCHFHYSTRFATKCAGCNSAILKQFVEINRNSRDECWHPECYMINKFWNVKVVLRRPQSVIADEGAEDAHQQLRQPQPHYIEEEQKETAVSLKEKQSRMEQQVYRIWTVLSAFEESSAACISDMLKQVSNGQYLDAIRMADKFILHVEVLFASIDDLEWYFARMNLKGMSHVREARMLCRKTVELFTLLSHTQETGARRMGMTQELLALVTGLAHYLKILIRIALTGALKLEREHECREAMTNFLDKLHLLAVQGGNPLAKRMLPGSGDVSSSISTATAGNVNLATHGVTYGFRSLTPENVGESPFGPSRDPNSKPNSSPPSDLCITCRKTVEEDCVRLGTYQRWHSACVQCHTCGVNAAPPVPPKEKEPANKTSEDGKEPAPKLSSARKPPANVDFFVYDMDSLRETSSFGDVPTVIFCTTHGHNRCRAGFVAVPRLEQYAFLLNVALRRLYLLLKKQGVVPVSPTLPTSSIRDSDPYRNSSDMRMKTRLDRKLSATARIPKRSTIVESPSGKSAQPGNMPPVAKMEQQAHKPHITGPSSTNIPGGTAVRPAGQTRSPPQTYQQPTAIMISSSTSSSSSSGAKPTSQMDLSQPLQQNQQQIIRPSFTRYNTGVMIREDNAPGSPSNEYPPANTPTQDDTITLADLANFMEAPKPSATPYIAELSPLELTLVKFAALSSLTRGPLRDQLDMDELLESIEIKKSGFWNKLFKAEKKNNKKKGVFGVPLELLVEREGADSVLGATNATLRVPSFIDDVVSAMRQMDMSIEGIFRKNGNIRRLRDLTEAIDRDANSVDLTMDNPVQLAALLKKFLRDLPDPLMTFKLYRLLCATLTLPEGDQHRQLRYVSLLLPKAHRDTMEVLFVFLKWVASFAHMDEETGSKMDLPNLATVICPSILYSRGRDAVRDDQFGAINVVTLMLEHQEEFLTVPPELMPIVKDQDYFAGSIDLPSKDFLKKCDTYLRTRQSNGGGGGHQPQQQQHQGGGGGRPGNGGATPRVQSPALDHPQPLRPGMGTVGSPPSDRLMRGPGGGAGGHPGMPPSAVSYPPPVVPTPPPSSAPQRPAPLEESLSWTGLGSVGNTPSSRPSSYVQPRAAPPPPGSSTSLDNQQQSQLQQQQPYVSNGGSGGVYQA